MHLPEWHLGQTNSLRLETIGNLRPHLSGSLLWREALSSPFRSLDLALLTSRPETGRAVYSQQDLLRASG